MKKLIASLCVLTQSVYCFGAPKLSQAQDDRISAIQQVLDAGLLLAAEKANLSLLVHKSENTYEPLEKNTTVDRFKKASVLLFTDAASKDPVTGGSLAMQYLLDEETGTLSLTPGLYYENSKNAEFNESEKTSFSLSDTDVDSKITDQVDLIKTSFEAEQQGLGLNADVKSKPMAGGQSGITSSKSSFSGCVIALIKTIFFCSIQIGIVFWINSRKAALPTKLTLVLVPALVIIGLGSTVLQCL